ncbi:MAG: hypothetical protein ABFC56_06245 [Clostridiaceae bacterium]
MKRTLIPFCSAIFCLLFLIACAPKQVENKSIDVLLNGVSTKCLYTGAYQFKPTDVGEYKFSTGEEEWIFIGEAGEKSALANGSVEDMPYSFKHDGEKYETFYTGEVENLKPINAILIKDYHFVLQYDDRVLEGIYNGYLLNEKPEGQGEFNFEDKEDYFVYRGNWKAGEISGDGELECNFYVVHFSYADRIGEYKGETTKGIAKGNGSFTAINGDGLKYTYIGAWENGLFEGKGRCEFDDETSWIQDGNFSKGDYKPSVADLFVTMGSAKDSKFKISTTEYEFIEAHESYFTGKVQEIGDEFIDNSFKYEEFSKNPNAFELSIIRQNGLYVIQVFEYEGYGHDFVQILANDSKYRVYYIYLIGKASNIVEGSRIQFVGLPVDYFTYKSVSGSDVWAIACVGIMATKK